MRYNPLKRIFIGSLILCFVLVSTAVAGSLAKHAIHQGHDKNSHSQTWCGWICKAGQAIQAPSLEVDPTFYLITIAEDGLPVSVPLILTNAFRSRAPPILSS
jgi:hypothetical protein